MFTPHAQSKFPALKQEGIFVAYSGPEFLVPLHT